MKSLWNGLKKKLSFSRKVWIGIGVVLVIVIALWCLKGNCGNSGSTVEPVAVVSAEATVK